jgi:hypothetical protein
MVTLDMINNDYYNGGGIMCFVLTILLISLIQIELPNIKFPSCEIKIQSHKNTNILYCDTKSLFFKCHISLPSKLKITSLPPIIPIDPQMGPAFKIEINNSSGIGLVSVINSQVYKILNLKTKSDLIKIITDICLKDKKVISITKVKFSKSSAMGKQYWVITKDKLQELIIVGSNDKFLIVINIQFPSKEITIWKNLIKQITQSLIVKVKDL